MKLSKFLPLFSVLVLASTTALAHADSIETFTSSAGECCFQVQLDQVSTTDVKVTVSLIDGATYWAQTGGPHRGFTFNLDTTAISIANISSPWNSTNLHLSSTSDAYGTFTDWFDNGWESGTSAHIGTPLSFDVVDAAGISFSDFTKSTGDGGGSYFSADFLGNNGGTGEAGLSGAGVITTNSVTPNNVTPITPEPSSLLLLGTGIVGMACILRSRIVPVATRS